MPAVRRTHGFSTLELLVTMALLSLIVAQILSVVGSQQQSAAVHQDVLETQEDARLVAEAMLSDLRMAGFMVPRIVGLSSGDGGTGGPDRVCVSDASAVDLATLVGVGDRFPGARLESTLGGTATSLDLDDAGEFDIDSNGDVDFSDGAGIIVSDGTRSHCARITGLDTGTGQISFTPATPGGFSAGTAFTRVVPAIVYEVTAAGLRRNNIVFARQVEDVQVRFLVDGTVVEDLDGETTDAVRTVELSIVARTERDDLDSVAGQRPALANRDPGPADNFRRRVLTNTIAPRNYL